MVADQTARLSTSGHAAEARGGCLFSLSLAMLQAVSAICAVMRVQDNQSEGEPCQTTLPAIGQYSHSAAEKEVMS